MNSTKRMKSVIRPFFQRPSPGSLVRRIRSSLLRRLSSPCSRHGNLRTCRAEEFVVNWRSWQHDFASNHGDNEAGAAPNPGRLGNGIMALIADDCCTVVRIIYAASAYGERNDLAGPFLAEGGLRNGCRSFGIPGIRNFPGMVRDNLRMATTLLGGGAPRLQLMIDLNTHPEKEVLSALFLALGEDERQQNELLPRLRLPGMPMTPPAAGRRRPPIAIRKEGRSSKPPNKKRPGPPNSPLPESE